MSWSDTIGSSSWDFSWSAWLWERPCSLPGWLPTIRSLVTSGMPQAPGSCLEPTPRGGLSSAHCSTGPGCPYLEDSSCNLWQSPWGVLLGLLAGYYGRWIDALVTRLADIIFAFPTLLLLIAVATAVRPSLPVVFLVIGLVGWAGMARAQPPTPSWGAMVADGRDLLRVAPWVAFAPGLAIGLAVLGFNLVGDGLREAYDPKLRSER